MVAIQDATFEAANALRETFVGDAGYGLAYGSHPAGTATPRSDLDLVLISPQPLTPDELTRLIDAVLDLHHVHGLELDTEVDYSIKAHASFADVEGAVRLGCFDIDEGGHVTASAVVVEPWLLNSRTFARRLLLNALTSPHVFLGGDVTTYDRHRERAEVALALLALSLLRDMTRLTLGDAITAVTQSPEVASGKDFLGYTPTPHLAATLHRGLGQLAERRVLRGIDGTQFEADLDECEAAIKHLRAEGEPRPTAWENACGEGGLLSD